MPRRAGTTLRIKGLVKSSASVREQLAFATADRLPAIRKHALSVCTQVDEILRTHGASIYDLPRPSRNAYEYLREIDWSNVNTNNRDGAVPPKSISIKGVTTQLDQLLFQLDRPTNKSAVEKIKSSINELISRIDEILAKENSDPSHLARKSREAYGWCRFLIGGNRIAQYIGAHRYLQDALSRNAKTLPRNAKTRRTLRQPIRIEFRPVASIFRMTSSESGTILRIITPLITLDHAGLDALAATIRGTAGARNKLLKHMEKPEYKQAYASAFLLSSAQERTRGAVHDLNESFDRVNREYFQGTLEKPRLAWTKRTTSSIFGHYSFATDKLTISTTLDAQRVPLFVVDFVMYHELLHKFHGIKEVGGRRNAHTREFRADEKKFTRYKQAEEFITCLAAIQC